MIKEQKLYFTFSVAIIAAIISGVSNIPFNVMPMILGSAADHLDLVVSQMGMLGGAILFGWVAGTAICFFTIDYINWRTISVSGLLLAVLGLLLSLLAEQTIFFYLSWFVLGVGCSLPTCVTFKVLAQTENKERSFGMMTFSVVIISAIVLYSFPVFLLSQWRYTGLVFGFSVLLLSLIFIAWKLPTKRLLDNTAKKMNTEGLSNRSAWIAFIAFMFFFAGQSGLWAFLELAGREIELTLANIGLVLAILKMVGGLAGITAMLIAVRFGNRWPFVMGFLGIVAGVILLQGANSLMLYAAGGWIWEFFFTLIFCYATATISRLDKTGKVVVLIPGAIGLSGSIGPVVAGFLKTGPGFFPIYSFTVICTFICMCIFLLLLSKEMESPNIVAQQD